jgi:hypothetical protein
MPTAPSNTASKLGGVDVFFDRRFSGDLGQGINVPLAMTQGFEDKLDQCFNELWSVVPLGKPNKIFTAGAFTNKPGFHGLGRAFDLDGFEWTNRKFIVLEDGARNGDRKFYFGIEAILKRHFGVVLDYLFNTDHHDHFHLDDSLQIDFSASAKSKVVFLQGALIHVFGLSIGAAGIDGQMGPNTQQAVNQALAKLGISGSISNKNVWLQFLLGTAKEAFGSSITPRNIAITKPTDDSEFIFGDTVHFAGTADPEVETIKLIAEDKFHFDTSRVVSGKWEADHQFTQAGNREIVVKGFDSSNRQVSRKIVNITLKVTALAAASFPETSSSLLGTIPETLGDANKVTQITQPFQGANTILKFQTGQLYLDSTMYISANGSPNVSLFDPIHGLLETSLKHPGRTGQEQFVDSEKIPYFLLPQDLLDAGNIKLGDIGVFILNNQITYAVLADVGEAHKSVGGSIALASALGGGIVDNIVNRGISDNVICIIFPNSGDGTPQTPEKISEKGKELFESLGGNPPL